MKLKKPGKNTLKVEVQNVSPHGIWILIQDNEYFLDYKNYPWFKKAPVSEVFKVKLVHNSYLHWPTLDVDLELESLKNPESYPLIYQ